MIYLWENICRIQLFIFVQGTLIQEIYIYIYYFFGSWQFYFFKLRYKWMVLLRFFCKIYFVIIANLFLHSNMGMSDGNFSSQFDADMMLPKYHPVLVS